jgi:hypothetical protein
MVFIYMNNIEQDVKVLKKLLNSPLFLDKYPIIERVFVDEQYGNKIDIVMSITDPSYWAVRDEITSYIWSIAKMSGVTSRFNIYP